MNRQQIEKAQNRINNLFKQKRLKEIFEQLKMLAKSNSNWLLSEKLSELESTYNNLIHYLVEGTKDPDHDRIYNQLLRDTCNLYDDMFEGLALQLSGSVFSEQLRLAAMRQPVSIDEYREAIDKQISSASVIDLSKADGYEKLLSIQQVNREHEKTVQNMFYSIFSSPRANTGQIEDYRTFMANDLIPVNDRCMVISAMGMSLLYRFDFRKIEFMLETCEHKRPEFALRAIISIIPIFQIHGKQWQFYPELKNRLQIMADNPEFSRRLMMVIIQYIQAHETEKVTKILTEEIIPEISRLSPIIGKKIGLDEWMEESGFEEKNPEWQKMLEESGLNDKLQEFSEMQQSGADVLHSTFSRLKNYPFFNEMANWFLPFDNKHSKVQDVFMGEQEGMDTLKTLLDYAFMCDSDKYSFSFSMLAMPEEYRLKLVKELDMQGEELKEMASEDISLNPFMDEETICKHYVQDIYRFFKLFDRDRINREDNIDIFDLPLDYHRNEAFQSVVAEPKNLERIALYYFEKNNFAEAAETYEQLTSLIQQKSEFWQKTGYCRQMLGNIAGALEAYQHADLIEDNNTWVLRRMAQCYRLLKKAEEALVIYRRLEHLKPDDLNIQLNIGHCYLELKQYDEALNYYFKVEVIDGSNTRAWRSIAWCAFLSRRFDVAQKYYSQIIEKKANAHDFLNAGHVELCMGNTKQAVEYYKQSRAKLATMIEFRAMMQEDESELFKAGVDHNTLPIIMDKIQLDELEGQ